MSASGYRRAGRLANRSRNECGAPFACIENKAVVAQQRPADLQIRIGTAADDAGRFTVRIGIAQHIHRAHVAELHALQRRHAHAHDAAGIGLLQVFAEIARIVVSITEPVEQRAFGVTKPQPVSMRASVRVPISRIASR